MSALTEIRAGTPSTEFSSLLCQTVLAVAIRGNFPSPDGPPWTKAKAAEVASAFLAQPRAQKIIDALALTAGDDHALAWLLQGAVRNFLRDRGRQTEIGRLIVRLRRAVKERDDFVTIDGRWALRDGPAEASGANPEALVAATADVPVDFTTWSPTARRNEPFADKASLEALIRSVLEAAGGSLLVSDIANAIAPRLQVVSGPMLVSLDAGDYPETGPSTAAFDAIGADLANREHALELFQLLTDKERIALGRADLGTRALGAALGLGHTQAALVRQRAVAMLTDALSEDEDGQETAQLVIALATQWCEERTDSSDSTYNLA